MHYTPTDVADALTAYLNGATLDREEVAALESAADLIREALQVPDLDAPHLLPEDFAV